MLRLPTAPLLEPLSDCKPEEFSVLTINVLCPKHGGGHDCCPEEFRSWEYRSALILGQIVALAPDAFCVQELQADISKAFLNQLHQAGYQSTYYEQPGSRTRAPHLGVAIGYKRGGALGPHPTFPRATRLNFGKLWDSIRPFKYSTGYGDFWSGTYHVALMLPLQHTASGRPVLLATSHLFADIGGHKPFIKLLQVHSLLQELRGLQEQLQCPLVLAGDLNVFPGSCFHRYFTGGEVERSEPALEALVEALWKPPSLPLQHEGLCSAYKRLEEVQPGMQGEDEGSGEPRYTACYQLEEKDDDGFFKISPQTLDYILYSKEDLEIRELLPIPALPQREGKTCAIPAEGHPSDHVTLMARFGFK